MKSNHIKENIAKLFYSLTLVRKRLPTYGLKSETREKLINLTAFEWKIFCMTKSTINKITGQLMNAKEIFVIYTRKKELILSVYKEILIINGQRTYILIEKWREIHTYIPKIFFKKSLQTCEKLLKLIHTPTNPFFTYQIGKTCKIWEHILLVKLIVEAMEKQALTYISSKNANYYNPSKGTFGNV